MASPEMGEYIVGAYLKVIEKCDVVDYGVRSPDGGLKGLNEIDVVGMHFATSTVFLCEAITHIQGALYGSPDETIKRVQFKLENHHRYASERLKSFGTKRSMLWSPVVSKGLASRLADLVDIELVVNQTYRNCVMALRRSARKETRDTGNPAFRLLQILEHLKGVDPIG